MLKNEEYGCHFFIKDILTLNLVSITRNTILKAVFVNRMFCYKKKLWCHKIFQFRLGSCVSYIKLAE